MGWCPWQRNVIATGGGWNDGELRIWDTDSRTCVIYANTNSQVLKTPRCSRDIVYCLNIKWFTPNGSNCRSVLYDGLKRRDIWSQVTAFLSTTSPAGPWTFPRSAQPTSSQVREPEEKNPINVQPQPSKISV